MNYKEVYGGDYLKASMWPDGQIATPTISYVELSSITDRETNQEKPQLVLHFHRTDKKLGLNVTNADVLGNAFGDETDGWIGQRIRIQKVMIRAFGKMQPSLQISPFHAQQTAPAPAPPPPPQSKPKPAAAQTNGHFENDPFAGADQPETPPTSNEAVMPPDDDDGWGMESDDSIPF